MKETFADTFYYLAVLHADDAAHERAMELSGRLTGPTVTTAWVPTGDHHFEQAGFTALLR